MKFLQALGNFASLLQSPGRKRKREQIDSENAHNSRPRAAEPVKLTADPAPSTSSAPFSDIQQALAAPSVAASSLLDSEGKLARSTQTAKHAQPVVKHTQRSQSDFRSHRQHTLQHIAAQQSALRQRPHPLSQQPAAPQVPAPIPYAQLTKEAPQVNIEQLLAAKDREIAALREKLSQQQAAGIGGPADQSRHSLQMAQNPNINLKERAEYGKLVAMANEADHYRTTLQRPAQHAGTSASSPITLDTPARPGVKHENQPQETTATIQQPDFQTTDNTQGHMPPQPLLQQAPFRTPTATPDHTQKANSNPPYALQQGYSSPAFRPRRLAQNSPATGFQSGTYSPHGAVAASEQSLKAAAELAEMLQRHQPWRDSDTVAVAEPQKAPARDAMADAVARSKAFIASLSSPSTAVQQAEQKAEHALSLRKFQQAVQEPAVAQQPASPLSPGKKGPKQSPHGRSPKQQQRHQEGEGQGEAELDGYGQARSYDKDEPNQSANGYSEQSEEELSAAFSELTSREGQLEPVLQPTRAMLDAQAKAFAKGQGEKEELVDHKHSGVVITRKDIRTLASRAWLNDEVMNIYMGLLQERDVELRKLDGYSRCHFFNTFFINKLYKDDNQYAYKNVRRWTSKFRLDRWGQPSTSVLDCDKLIVPVHLGCHWTCAVINLREQQIHYFDSLGGKDKAVIESLARWVVDEYKDKRKEDVDTSEWPRISPDNTPQQLNSCDCGVFTLMFADYQSRDANFTFDQRHMEYFRIKVIADIMGTKVDIPSKHSAEDSS